MPSPYRTITRYYQLDKRDLVYLKFILEAYEGLTTLSTVEKVGVIVSVSFGDDVQDDVDLLLQALGDEISLTEMRRTDGGYQELTLSP